MRRREKRGASPTPRVPRPPRRHTKRLTASSPTGSSRSLRAASSARPELAISRIAEARDDVALLVEALAERRDTGRNVGVRARGSAHAFRTGDEADVRHALAAPLLQDLDRRDRGLAAR